MQDNGRESSENKKLILFNEVGGFFPICGDNLTQLSGKNFQVFEIAHIYLANPLPLEVELLKGKLRLSEDVNDLKNFIAVCKSAIEFL